MPIDIFDFVHGTKIQDYFLKYIFSYSLLFLFNLLVFLEKEFTWQEHLRKMGTMAAGS
jgi:hypothetical protein